MDKKLSEQDLFDLGFEVNPSFDWDLNYTWDEYIHSKIPDLSIAEFNGEGYKIEGMDWIEPINDKEKFQRLINAFLSLMNTV